MGGCDTSSGKIIYLHDWKKNKCAPRMKNQLEPYKEDIASGTQLACCRTDLDWSSTCDEKNYQLDTQQVSYVVLMRAMPLLVQPKCHLVVADADDEVIGLVNGASVGAEV